MTPAATRSDPESLSTRDRILDAAERVAATAGAGNMTLDAVVQEAGVSKGGLLYHFPGKEALLQAMVDRYCAHWHDVLQTKLAGSQDCLAGHVRSALETHLQMRAAKPREVTASLLAAAATNPGLLAEPRARHAELIARMQQLGGDFPLALVLLAAIDGLTLSEMLGLGVLTEAQHGQLLARLRELTQACVIDR